MGILKLCLTLMPGKGEMTEIAKLMGWNFRGEAKARPPTDECPTPHYHFVMNIIMWNSRGVLKPNFHKHIKELTRNHEPAMFMVMETRLGGERAKEITYRLPFDGVIHIVTIGVHRWLMGFVEFR